MKPSQSSPARGIVSVSWAPLRREPRHAAEMVSQALLGETLRIEPGADESDGKWVSASTPDGYTGFLTTGSFRSCSREEASDWEGRAVGFSLGTQLVPIRDSSDGLPNHAPWGSRIGVEGEAVVLPGGALILPEDPSAIRQRPDSTVTESAMKWLGVPYLWGGRTEHGADCSGFVQSVYAFHGIVLKRDSRDQFEAGPVVMGPPGAGDLLYFAWDDKPISHVGLSLGGGRMIHASETRGCVAIDVLGEGGFGRRLAAGHAGTVRPLG